MADQKCWTCKKYSGGCPWTDEDPEKQRTAFKPVPGWIAVKTVKHDGSEGGMESYDITIWDIRHMTACMICLFGNS